MQSYRLFAVGCQLVRESMKLTVMAAVLLAAAVSPGCWSPFRRAPKAALPSPRPLVLPVPAKTEPQPLPEPPEIAAEIDVTQLPEIPLEKLPAPPRPRPRPHAPATPGQPEVPATEAQEQQPPAAALPSLGQVLTAEQQQAYNSSIDRNLDRANRTLSQLSHRRLNHEQATYLERIRVFAMQASDARRTDLVRAASLAERAALLAEDLQKSVR